MTVRQHTFIYQSRIFGSVLEVESKYRCQDNDDLEEKLRKIGARKLSTVEMEDSYFRHPSRDFGATDEALRLRRIGDSGELTYKGPRMRMDLAKAREEVTLRVDDLLSARRILERLGFEELITVRKRRCSFVHDTVCISLDDVEGLGRFVELELMTEDPGAAEMMLAGLRDVLALTTPVRETYVEMMLGQKRV